MKMGCGSSKPSVSVNDFETSELRLTERQVQLIRDSWGLIQEDIVATGLEIYANFLRTLESDILHLFPKIVSKNDTGQKFVVDEENLQQHAMIVMDGIGRVVENIDDTNSLTDFLQYVGQKHVQNNVKPHMLERLWPAMDDSFQSVLQDVYTKELRDSWKMVIDFIIIKIQEIMEEHRNRRVNENGANHTRNGISGNDT